MLNETDEALMCAYVGGDKTALAVLYRRYAPSLVEVAEQRLGSPELAQEVVRQTFVQLHRARRDFRAASPVKPWLFAIAHSLLQVYTPARARCPHSRGRAPQRGPPHGTPGAESAPGRFKKKSKVNRKSR